MFCFFQVPIYAPIPFDHCFGYPRHCVQVAYFTQSRKIIRKMLKLGILCPKFRMDKRI